MGSARASRLRWGAADQRQCGAAWRRSAAASCAACRSMRSARRRPTPRVTRGSTLPQPARRESSACSTRSKPDLRLLHLCGEDRRDPARRAAEDHRHPGLSREDYRTPGSCAQRSGARGADPFAARGPPLRRAGGDRGVDRDRRDQPCCRRSCGSGLGARSKRRRAAERRCAAGPRRTAVQQTAPEMNGTRTGMGWGARLLIALVLIIAGAACGDLGAGALPAGGAIPRHRAAPQQPVMLTPQPVVMNPRAVRQPLRRRRSEPDAGREDREPREPRRPRSRTRPQRAEGSAGRADALVVAFAARRAIDRGVALGYLENLLVERFGPQHQRAVATIITASHQPVRLDDLIAEYETLGPELRRGGPQDSWWTNFRRELGALVEIHPPTARRRTPKRATIARRSASRRRRRPGAGRNHAPSRRIARRRLDRQGAPLHRRAPRARRDRIRRALLGGPTQPADRPGWQANRGNASSCPLRTARVQP